MMAELAAGWAQTVTAVNLAHLTSLTSLDPVINSLQHLKLSLPVCEVPKREEWRLGLLDRLMVMRTEKQKEGEDLRRVMALLSSLYST